MPTYHIKYKGGARDVQTVANRQLLKVAGRPIRTIKRVS